MTRCLGKLIYIVCFFCGGFFVFAAEAPTPVASPPEFSPESTPVYPMEPRKPQRKWGVAMGLRYAEVPFKTGNDSVTDIIPMFYYEGKHFFLRGLEGGLRVWRIHDAEVNIIGRYRFFDIPKEYQNEIRGDALDMGFQHSLTLRPDWWLDTEVLTDTHRRIQAIMRIRNEYVWQSWLLQPEVEMRFKTPTFNSHYYGLLNEYHVGAGVDMAARVKARFHVFSNFHIVASIEANFLDHNARHSPAVKDRVEWQAFLGFGFFNMPPHVVEELPPVPPLKIKPYWRLAHGVGTDASILDVIMGDFKEGDKTIQMSSLFYGHPLSETLLTLPIDVYISPGFVQHYHTSVQKSAKEYVLAVKFYYTIPLPWRVRIGFAEGISYVDNVTYYERKSLDKDGYRESHLLNYLDFSLDLNIGDVAKSKKLEDLWLGVSIHHRSGIFETSSMFGRIKGGSNFSTVYLQWSM